MITPENRNKFLYRVVGYWLWFSLLSTPMQGAPWIHPKTDFESTLDSEEMFSKYQELSASIWKNSNRSFLIRKIVGIPEYASSELTVISIVQEENDGYALETVTFIWSKKSGWTVKDKLKSPIKKDLALKAHSIVRNILVNMKTGDRLLGPGPDGLMNIWECPHEIGKGTLLQGVQYSIPDGEKELDEFRFLRNVLTGIS